MAIGSRSPHLNIPCWLDGIPELRFVQHLADLVLTASQRFVHRELTERVTFVFVIVIVPLQITAEPALPLPSSCDGQPSVGPLHEDHLGMLMPSLCMLLLSLSKYA